MNRIEHTDLTDERELTLLSKADAYEQIAHQPWGAALEVMRQVAARRDLAEEDRPIITIQRHGGVVVQLDEGHDPGWAHVLATVLGVDLDTKPVWVSDDGGAQMWETDTYPRMAIMLDNYNGGIA